MLRVSLTSLFMLMAAPMVVAAQPAAESWEVIVEGQTTIRLKEARFTAGVRQLAWLNADAPPAKKGKAAVGLEYLEFREEKSTGFKDGIITYIPVASLVRLDYDHDKKKVRVVVKQASDKDLTLIGTTKYVGINKFSLDGKADKTAISVAGEIQLQDGLMKTPFVGFSRPGAQAVAPPTGRGAVVVAKDVPAPKKKELERIEHSVHGLTPLYRVGAGQRMAGVLMFQKIGQVEVSKIAALRQLPAADKKQPTSHEYEVTFVGGDKQTLTLLDDTQLGDKQKATLLGLVGRVPAGYKLFPPHTIGEMRFEVKGD